MLAGMQAVILAGIPPEEHAATRALLDEARLHFVKVVNCDRCRLHTLGKKVKIRVNKCKPHQVLSGLLPLPAHLHPAPGMSRHVLNESLQVLYVPTHNKSI